MFTGYSIVSEFGKNYLNFEVENTLKFLDTNRIKQKTQEKLGYRRNRLRHRPIRNTNRICKKITYISNYYYQQVRNFVERICKYYPSSQLCSNCNFKNIKMKNLSNKIFKCPNCKIKIDRDYNASLNILKEGKRLRLLK